MIKTTEVAVDLVTNKLDVCDLMNSVSFLNEVDHSLKKLFKQGLYSGSQIIKKRKQLIDKISSLQEMELEF